MTLGPLLLMTGMNFSRDTLVALLEEASLQAKQMKKPFLPLLADLLDETVHNWMQSKTLCRFCCVSVPQALCSNSFLSLFRPSR